MPVLLPFDVDFTMASDKTQRFYMDCFREKISGWMEFLLRVNNTGLYPILSNQKGHEIGYLYLLEQSLGNSVFHQSCPLVLRVWKEFVPASKNVLEFAACLSQEQSSKELWSAYCKMQHKKAKALMPIGMGQVINNALEIIVGQFVSSAFLWPYYRTYLEIRYGLKTGLPVKKQNKIKTKIIRSFERTDDEMEYVSEGAIYRWMAAVEDSLQGNLAQKLLRKAAELFTIERKPDWGDLCQDTLREIHVPDTTPITQRILELHVDQLFHGSQSGRVATSLIENGVEKVKHLIKKSEAWLVDLKGIDGLRLGKIMYVLQIYSLRLCMTDLDISLWEKSMSELKVS